MPRELSRHFCLLVVVAVSHVFSQRFSGCVMVSCVRDAVPSGAHPMSPTAAMLSVCIMVDECKYNYTYEYMHFPSSVGGFALVCFPNCEIEQQNPSTAAGTRVNGHPASLTAARSLCSCTFNLSTCIQCGTAACYKLISRLGCIASFVLGCCCALFNAGAPTTTERHTCKHCHANVTQCYSKQAKFCT